MGRRRRKRERPRKGPFHRRSLSCLKTSRRPKRSVNGNTNVATVNNMPIKGTFRQNLTSRALWHWRAIMAMETYFYTDYQKLWGDMVDTASILMALQPRIPSSRRGLFEALHSFPLYQTPMAECVRSIDRPGSGGRKCKLTPDTFQNTVDMQ